MLIWINGPFGAGKTHTAFELHRRLPGSVVSDPELIGHGLNRMQPPGLRGDFQDFPAWRQGVFEVLDRLLTGFDGVVIVPMTIASPDYLAETVGRLRGVGHEVHHVTLIAGPETIRGRITARSLPCRKPDHFALDRVEPYLHALGGPDFAEHIHTDGLTVGQVTELVAEKAGVELCADESGPLRARARRLLTTLKHVRIG